MALPRPSIMPEPAAVIVRVYCPPNRSARSGCRASRWCCRCWSAMRRSRDGGAVARQRQVGQVEAGHRLGEDDADGRDRRLRGSGVGSTIVASGGTSSDDQVVARLPIKALPANQCSRSRRRNGQEYLPAGASGWRAAESPVDVVAAVKRGTGEQDTHAVAREVRSDRSQPVTASENWKVICDTVPSWLTWAG